MSLQGRFEGEVVVITGAASGIGRAAARLFAREGARLALCDVDVLGLEETARNVRAEHDVDIFTQECDLANVASVEKFARSVLERFDAIEVIYNNAGVMLRQSIEDTTEADWDRISDINVKGPFFLVKFLLPGLIKSGHASIVNVSSISGIVPPREGNAAYATSKGAVLALTRAQARDLVSYGIRANCLVPGPIDTPMPAGAFEALPADIRQSAREAAVARNIIKRFGTVDEVASVAVFLASREASYITGAMIAVDGGWTAS